MSNKLFTYDPKRVSMIYAGAIIDGFADGEFISAERNEDSANFEPGAQGGGTRTLSSNKSGRVTVRLQQSSPSNSVFNQQLKAMESGRGGLAPLLIKDNDSGDIIASATMWVTKPPVTGFSNEQSNREWVLETQNLDLNVAGQSA